MGRPKSSTRTFVEDCQAYSIQQFKDPNTNSVDITEGCTTCGNTVKTSIRAIKTRKGLKFLCPRCGQRIEKVYRPNESRPGEWACRNCHHLIYQSQYEKG